MKHRDLHRKLQSIEALRDGATTPHERRAAAKARERVLRRLKDLGPPPPLRPVVIDVAPTIPDAMKLPSKGKIRRILEQWARGDRDAASVGRWASRVVDRVLLPDIGPSDPRSIPIEIILQLSCHRRQPLTQDDVPVLLAFLDAPADRSMEAWRAWLDFLGSIEWKQRRAIAR